MISFLLIPDHGETQTEDDHYSEDTTNDVGSDVLLTSHLEFENFGNVVVSDVLEHEREVATTSFDIFRSNIESLNCHVVVGLRKKP